MMLKDIITNQIASHKKLVKFLVSGGTAATVEYGVFLLLVFIGLNGQNNLIWAQSISFVFGLGVSFILNKAWVFKASGESRKMFFKYSSLALVNLVLSNIILLLTSGFIAAYLGKIVTMAAIAAWNYVIFQRYIFR